MNKIGVTVDRVSGLRRQITVLKQLPAPVWVRLVCDPGEDPDSYESAVDQLLTVPGIELMIQPVDSLFCEKLSKTEYLSRFQDYVTAFKGKAHSVEVGNELSGDWLGPDSETIPKVTEATKMVNEAGMKSHLCLYLEDPNSGEAVDLPMFKWAKKLDPSMRSTLSSVGASYYEGANNGELIKSPRWCEIFNAMEFYFPNSDQSISEFGFEELRGVPVKSIENKLYQYWNVQKFEGYPLDQGVSYWNFSETVRMGDHGIQAILNSLK